MRKHFDMLLRNTFFLPWGKLGDHATPIEVPADIDTKPYEAADDLVEKEVREIGKRDPGLIDTPKARERTTDEVRTKLAGNR